MKSIVLNEFIMDGKRVITVDNKPKLSELKTLSLKSGDKKYSYHLTYNDFVFVVDTTDSFLGKQVEFVN